MIVNNKNLRSGDAALLHSAEKLHMKPVVAMAYSPAHDVVISADQVNATENRFGECI